MAHEKFPPKEILLPFLQVTRFSVKKSKKDGRLPDWQGAEFSPMPSGQIDTHLIDIYVDFWDFLESTNHSLMN